MQESMTTVKPSTKSQDAGREESKDLMADLGPKEEAGSIRDPWGSQQEACKDGGGSGGVECAGFGGKMVKQPFLTRGHSTLLALHPQGTSLPVPLTLA